MSVEIKLLTYNIFLRPPPIKTNESDHKDDRMKEFVEKEMKNFNIICFQELFSAFNSRKEYFIEGGSKLGLKYHASLDRDLWKLKPIDSGLLTLTKFEILESDSIIYDQGLYSDSYATKGVLSTLLKIKDDIKLLVFTTHLQAVYEDEKTQYTKVQKTQLIQMRNFILKKMKEHPKVDLLLCGDFNVDANLHDNKGELTYQEMYDILHSDQKEFKFENLHPDHPITYGDYTIENGKKLPKETVITYSLNSSIGACLDYIFFCNITDTFKTLEAKREPFYVKNKTFTQLSDHLGLSIKLKLNKE